VTGRGQTRRAGEVGGQQTRRAGEVGRR